MKKTPFKRREIRPCDKCYKPLELHEVGRCTKHVEMYGPVDLPLTPKGRNGGRPKLPESEKKVRKYNWRGKWAKMPGKPLTEIEQQTLQLLADGKTAKNWGGKHTTFDARLLKARTKLGAKTTPQAIAIAFRQGIIE